MILPGGSSNIEERDELVAKGKCPDCGDTYIDTPNCQTCGGTGNAPRCIQCGKHVDPRAVVRADDDYCPACAAKEIGDLWSESDRLMAEVARLQTLIAETCAEGIAIADGCAHA